MSESRLLRPSAPSTDAELIGNLAKSRVLVHELLESQRRLIGAASAAIAIIEASPLMLLRADGRPVDIRGPNIVALLNKEIAAAVKVP